MNTKLKESAEKFLQDDMEQNGGSELVTEYPKLYEAMSESCALFATSEAARLYWKEQFKLEYEEQDAFMKFLRNNGWKIDVQEKCINDKGEIKPISELRQIFRDSNKFTFSNTTYQ